jgi:hypothetical protein
VSAKPTYASITYAHPSFFVRYPHLKRLRLLDGVLRRRSFRSWLDYGAGDAAVFAYCDRMQSLRDVRAVLYEPWDVIRNEISIRVSGNHSVVPKFEDIPNEKFDLITALEVLEHLPLSERIRFYELVAGRLSADGRCLIEVPVETGPILVVKELGRRYLKGRSRQYATRELLEACFGKIRDAQGRYQLTDNGETISSHYGFDTFGFIDELRAIGRVGTITPSPFSALPAILNQCVLIEYEPVAPAAEIDRIVRAFAAARAT